RALPCEVASSILTGEPAAWDRLMGKRATTTPLSPSRTSTSPMDTAGPLADIDGTSAARAGPTCPKPRALSASVASPQGEPKQLFCRGFEKRPSSVADARG